MGRLGAGALAAIAAGLLLNAVDAPQPRLSTEVGVPAVTHRAATGGGVLGDRSSATQTSSLAPPPASAEPPDPASYQLAGEAPPPPPAPPTAPLITPGRTSLRVPILMYHYIRVNPVAKDLLGADLSVSPADFAREMDWISAQGYHPVDFNDLRAYFAGRAPLPTRPVVLTFDDGYNDLYTAAYPVLKQHGFKAVAYIVSGFLGRHDNVSREQVVEMDRNGIEIASHTVDHADLTRVSGSQLAHQVVDSKADLERLLGHPVLDFCYPSGQFNASVVQAVQAAGYQSATTTQLGSTHSPGDRFTWSRVRVHGVEALDVFASFMAADEAAPGAPVGPVPVLATQAPPAPPFRLPSSWPMALRQDLVMETLSVRARPGPP